MTFFILLSGMIMSAKAAEYVIEDLNQRRDTLFRDLQPPMVLLPLTNEVSQWVGHRGIDFQRRASSSERKMMIQTIARSCIMHPHKSFFELDYFREEKSAPRKEYVAHLTGLFVKDVGVRILESYPTLAAVIQLNSLTFSRHVQAFCQRLVENKDVALQPLTNDTTLRAGILSELASYSAMSYQEVLTPHFIDWYREVYALHPGRKWDGMEEVNAIYVSPPPAPIQMLNITFRSGQRAQIDYEMKGIVFKGPVRLSGGWEITPHYIIYDGVTINFNVPAQQTLQFLQRSRTVQHASIETLKVPLEGEYAQATNHLVEEVNHFQEDDQINTLRTVTGISTIFMTLGVPLATQNWKALKKLLGKALEEQALLTVAELPAVTACKEIEFLCNEALELVPPEEQWATLNNYGYYLNLFAATLFQTRSLTHKKAIVHFKKAELLLQEALLQRDNEATVGNLRLIRKNLHALNTMNTSKK